MKMLYALLFIFSLSAGATESIVCTMDEKSGSKEVSNSVTIRWETPNDAVEPKTLNSVLVPGVRLKLYIGPGTIADLNALTLMIFWEDSTNGSKQMSVLAVADRNARPTKTDWQHVYTRAPKQSISVHCTNF